MILRRAVAYLWRRERILCYKARGRPRKAPVGGRRAGRKAAGAGNGENMRKFARLLRPGWEDLVILAAAAALFAAIAAAGGG